ncbi:MAG: M48 family metallopeptidase, partial [Actinobacteria bacterium]|nr:M48 family metallopeptidase [Actinomycetota bacterium]
APAEVRLDEAPPESRDPALGARFTPQQVARHGAYRGPAYLAIGLSFALQVAVLVILARGPFDRLVGRLGGAPGGALVVWALAGGAVVAVLTLAGLPLSFVRGYSIEQAWGLSTQSTGGWATDQLRSLLIGVITGAVGAVVFLAVVRWQPRTWWLWGWGAFTLLSLLLAFAWPVLVAPLFNRFTPLEDRYLAGRIRALAAAADVSLGDVLVADASRRSTAENAYVAGLAKTKRVVLYDTLLRSGTERETLFVVAHELGHESESHVLKNIALSSAGLFGGFAVLALLSGRGEWWSWAGAAGLSDARALPLLVLYATVVGLLTLPLQSAISRGFERRADQIALSLTKDPEAAVSSFRRLALSNLADLAPPQAAVAVLYSHPPPAERIRAALRAGDD